MKIVILTITLTFFLNNNVIAQINKDLLGDLSNQTGRSLYIRDLNKENVNEKHYISTEFKNAKVLGYELPHKYRYNGYTDDFEYIEENKIMVLLKQPNLTLKFLENGSVFRYVNFTNDKNELSERFLQVIVDEPNKYSLLKSYEVKDIDNEISYSYQTTDSKTTKTVKNFFLQKDNQITQIVNSTKKLKQIFGDQIESIIKSNKINLKNEQDLIKLVLLLNQ